MESREHNQQIDKFRAGAGAPDTSPTNVIIRISFQSKCKRFSKTSLQATDASVLPNTFTGIRMAINRSQFRGKGGTCKLAT